MTRHYYVCYKVRALTGDKEHRAGPYNETMYAMHRDDIAGYEGVSDVWIDVVIS